MKRNIRNALVILAILAIELGFIMPALAKWQADQPLPPIGTLTVGVMALLAFTVAIAWLAIGGFDRLGNRLKS